MIYTELTKKAMVIAFNVHRDQLDKVGVPYIYHPIHLAEQMDDEASTCVALLHDTVEDGDITFDDLKQHGFYDEIIEAVKLLTHDPEVPYMDYVAKVKTNSIATKVKLADLQHNSDLTRMAEIDEWALRRNQKGNDLHQR